MRIAIGLVWAFLLIGCGAQTDVTLGGGGGAGAGGSGGEESGGGAGGTAGGAAITAWTWEISQLDLGAIDVACDDEGTRLGLVRDLDEIRVVDLETGGS